MEFLLEKRHRIQAPKYLNIDLNDSEEVGSYNWVTYTKHHLPKMRQASHKVGAHLMK